MLRLGKLLLLLIGKVEQAMYWLHKSNQMRSEEIITGYQVH